MASKLVFLVAAAAAAAPLLPEVPSGAAPHPLVAAAGSKRILRKPRVLQTITVTDDNFGSIPDLFVAADQPTVLLFTVPVRDVLLSPSADVKFEPPEFDASYVRLIPRGDLPPGAWASLNVTLVDGNVLSFRLVTDPKEVDVRVDINVKLEKRAPPQSAQALKRTIEQLRAQLDECQATAGNAGVAKIAALVLAEKEAQVIELRNLRAPANKQNRMLLRARNVYRLFGYSYLVLEIYNRADSKIWEFGQAEVRLQGSGQNVELEVAAAAMEPPAIEPSATLPGKVVLAFKTPTAQQSSQRYTITLREKNGVRHVQLDSLDL